MNLTDICLSEQMWALERSFALSSEEDVSDAELLHVPIWFARYDHKGNKIVLVVDGNSGNVINSMGL